MKEDLRNRLYDIYCDHFDKMVEREQKFIHPGVMSGIEQQLDAIFNGYQLIGDVGYSNNIKNWNEQMTYAKELAKIKVFSEDVRLVPYIIRAVRNDELEVSTSAFYVYAKPLTPVEDAEIEKRAEKVMETLETA